MHKVAICIATYRRLASLDRLLRSLGDLDAVDAHICVIVVDNDPDGAARQVVASHRAGFPEFVYEVEPRRGISTVRNHLVALAQAYQCDLVCFVDDDEVVEPQWLAALLDALHRYEADVVAGPVCSKLPTEAPQWVRAGQFFDRHYHPEGGAVRWAGSGNVLVRRRWLDMLDGPFDERFRLTGGEDTHLFERLYRLGARAVWTNKAVAEETVPLSRTNVRWLLKRSYRAGSTLTTIVRVEDGCSKLLFLRLLKGLVQIGVGLVMIPVAVFKGRVGIVQTLMLIARGAGAVAGFFGHTVNEYQVTHGA